MRIAVISDIHANLHALEAVLAATEAEGVDARWCLGDVVGYGPRPNKCVELVRERTDLCLAGNHDLVVLGRIESAAFTGEAAAAAAWTRRVLEPESRTFLAGLEPSGRVPGAALFHGSPLDPVWDYVLDQRTAVSSFRATTEPLILVGHSHVALEISNGRNPRGNQATADAVVPLALGGPRRILNPGSVGQPRDGDPRASWLVIDTSSRRATFRRTEYVIGLTQTEMRERGLPASLSERLARGV
ncbi:MAG: metallophosphoesterase family protein [Actinobacteria bacterium]|nr:metallophosphoesterase family protein [Actinomycetota bacterium]